MSSAHARSVAFRPRPAAAVAGPAATQPDSGGLGLLASAVDRRRPVGIALVVVSAAGFGVRDGPLEADLRGRPRLAPAPRLAVRDRGGARLDVAARLADASARRSRRLGRRQALRRRRPRRLVHGQRRHVLRRARDGAGVARRRPRLPLPGDRRRPLAPVRDAAGRPAAVDRARHRARRRRPRPRRHRPVDAAAGRRDRARPRLAADLRRLDHPVGAARRRALRPPGPRVGGRRPGRRRRGRHAP